MKKNIIMGMLLMAISSYSDINMNSTVIDKHAFPLPQDQLTFKASYYTINDSVDVFNTIKSSSSNYIVIGETSGGGFEINYALSDKISLYYDFKYFDIDMGDSNLKNKENNIFMRVNIYQNMNFFINAISFDIGYRSNKGSDIEIKSDLMLNALIRSVFPGSHFYIYDGVIKYNGFTGSLYDKYGNKIYPFVKIENLEDRTSYIRLLFGKKMNDKTFDFYITYKNINIDTDFNVYPKENAILQGVLKQVGVDKIKFDKDENTIVAGFTYLQNFNNYIFELNYEYSYIDRDIKNIYNKNNNHVINLNLSKVINNNLLLYVGGVFMFNGISDQIPYLYNTYVKASEKYGYLKLGFIYNFNY